MSDTNGSAARLSTEELRAAVRAVLRDVLPVGTATAASGGARSFDGEVSLRTDADLAAFVRRVAALCEDSAQRAELQAGRHRFRLVRPAGGVDGLDGLDGLDSERGDRRDTHRVDRGAVTERAVKQAATEGKRLIVGRRAVLTPLARDKARTLGVVIEKES